MLITVLSIWGVVCMRSIPITVILSHFPATTKLQLHRQDKTMHHLDVNYHVSSRRRSCRRREMNRLVVVQFKSLLFLLARIILERQKLRALNIVFRMLNFGLLCLN